MGHVVPDEPALPSRLIGQKDCDHQGRQTEPLRRRQAIERPAGSGRAEPKFPVPSPRHKARSGPGDRRALDGGGGRRAIDLRHRDRRRHFMPEKPSCISPQFGRSEGKNRPSRRNRAGQLAPAGGVQTVADLWDGTVERDRRKRATRRQPHRQKMPCFGVARRTSQSAIETQIGNDPGPTNGRPGNGDSGMHHATLLT